MPAAEGAASSCCRSRGNTFPSSVLERELFLEAQTNTAGPLTPTLLLSFLDRHTAQR